MGSGSRVCPNCRRLNGATEKTCYNCGRRLTGPIGAGSELVATLKQLEFPATMFIIALCLLMFALCVVVNARGMPFAPGDQFSTSTLARFGVTGGMLGRVEPWRYLSAVFLHANVLHIGMNLFAMSFVAKVLEHEFGSARLLVLFVFSGALGFVVSDVWAGAYSGPTLGASGAVFGLFGADVGRLYGRRDLTWKRELMRNAVIALALAIGFPMVNNAAHVGGFLAGLPLGYLFQKERAAWRLGGMFSALAVIGLIASIAAIVLSNASPIWREFKRMEQRQI